MHLIGDAGIGKPDSEAVVGTPGDHAGEGDAAVEIDVDQVLVLWRTDHAGKDADALRILAAGHTPDEWVDDTVEAPIIVDRPARTAGHRDQRAARNEALILEGAEVIPAADLDGAGEAVLIVLVGAFDH